MRLTFHLEFAGVSHPGSRVGGYARVLSRVSFRQAGDVEEARIEVKGRDVNCQMRGQLSPVFEPVDLQGRITLTDATHHARARPLGESFPGERKMLNYGRNWKN